MAQHTPSDGRCDTVAVVDCVSCRPAVDIVGRTVEGPVAATLRDAAVVLDGNGQEERTWECPHPRPGDAGG